MACLMVEGKPLNLVGRVAPRAPFAAREGGWAARWGQRARPYRFTGRERQSPGPYLRCVFFAVWASGLIIGGGMALAIDSFQPAVLEIRVRSSGSAPFELRGQDARQQALAMGKSAAGVWHDFTRQAVYQTEPGGIVQVDRRGVITPLQDGTATITARITTGAAAQLSVVVKAYHEPEPISFPNQVVPVFTKAGCNAGGCHGKMSGQNGFRLSLLGFEPAEDYEHLVKESRGRRLFPAAPERSLLLLKATATLPHGGGQRLDPDSEDYRLLVRWILQGQPYGPPDAPTVERIEVIPPERVMTFADEQQLLVLAHYSDGSVRDATRGALYEANDKNLATVDGAGLVHAGQQPGEVAVMVRYQAKVGVFQASIPLGAPVTNLPPARNFIDERVFKKLTEAGMPPSAVCDDATFVRRAAVDIAGRLPTPEEAKRLLADRAPDKRDRWIDTLLSSADYADYFANKWSALLRNRRSDPRQMHGTYLFHDWIRDSFMANKPFDRFVRELLAASGEIAENPPVAWYRQVNNLNAQVEDTAQLFLGLRLQCAQCHHHPFEKWSQQDYYRFAAFFSQVGRQRSAAPGEVELYPKRGRPSAINKKNGQPVKPAGLGGPPLEMAADQDPRLALADWITQPQNPFFARSLVNRYWKHFFGRGLVEPDDDMRETNPPTNPELLQALAQHFIASGYDLKDLVRTLCRSTVYQLSSLPNQYNASDKQYFSRFYPKRLTAEVLCDALNQVAGAQERFEGMPKGTRAVQLPDNSFNASSYFLTVFGRPDSASACECERSQAASLAQSLHLLNAKEMLDKLAAEQDRPALLAKDRQRPNGQKVHELYYWVYSRPPEPQELASAETYLSAVRPGTKTSAETNERRGYEDLCWALLNSKEFLFNH